LWTLNASQDSGRFSLSCSVRRFSEDYAVALIPFRHGFIAFQKQPRAEYLGRESFDTPVCASGGSQDGEKSSILSGCHWDFGGEQVVTAAAGSEKDEFIVVRRTLDLDRVRLSYDACGLTASTLSSVKDFYYPWLIARDLNVAPEKGLTD